jgi:transcriptional regulator with XRE-family HTH domain
MMTPMKQWRLGAGYTLKGLGELIGRTFNDVWLYENDLARPRADAVRALRELSGGVINADYFADRDVVTKHSMKRGVK